MKKTKNIRLTCTLILGLAFGISICNPSKTWAQNSSTKILETDVSTPSSDTVLVGIEGSYRETPKAYVEKINKIRLEACEKGYPDPRDRSKSLSLNDYVPIKWSGDLQWIARIRAAESTINVDHVRPNLTSTFTLTAPSGVGSYGEVLAWGGDGISMWYGEKNDWINNTDAITGHYTSMINPDNLYVGISYFYSTNGAWTSSYAGEFSFDPACESDELEPLSNIIQTVEVKKSSLSSWNIYTKDNKKTNKIKLGKSKQYNLKAVTNYDGAKAYVTSLNNIKWSLSNKKATVSTYGKVTGKKVGKSKLKAVCNGKTYSLNLTIKPLLKKTSFTSYSVANKKLKLKWKKGTKSSSGYQVKYKIYGTSKYKTKNIKGRSKNKVSLSNLKSGYLYIIKVRSYKKIGKKKYYSSWSDELLLRPYF